MGELTETEIVDRHRQALGEAHRACQRLGKNADDDYLAIRGPDYTALKEAVELLEGSARQMAHFRSDARWLKLGVLYARTLAKIPSWFIGQKWKNFTALMPLFENGKRHLEDLNGRTGRAGPILPERPESWIIMDPWKSPLRQPTRH